MQEEKRYYTPTIEEFHAGFEYEAKSLKDNTWHPLVWGIERDHNNRIKDVLAQMEFFINTGQIRVKYLDKEDIEALGWKYVKTGDEFSNVALYFKIRTNEGFTSPDVYDMRFDPHNPGSLTITSWTDGSWGRNERSMSFYAKNKSDLKKLMDFVGIREIFIAKVKG